MTPIMFGSRERQLFGIYMPGVGSRKRKGVVICAPLGEEYQRSHRSCRKLAERLTNAGFDVLRFDYFGTGDSAGESCEVTLSGCVQDTLTAVEELAALAGIRRVTLVGLRLGAAIAQRAAVQVRTVDRLLLWDPVGDGSAYLDELGPIATGEALAPSAELRAELSALRPEEFSGRGVRDILLITSEEQPYHRQLVEKLRHGDAAVEWTVQSDPAAWREQAARGVGAVPVNIINQILNWAA